VVTGGNRGIGLEICKQLASNGITVVLTARDEKRGAEAVSTLGLSNVVFHQLEVSDPLSAARLADFIKEKFGKLDILVCTYDFPFFVLQYSYMSSSYMCNNVYIACDKDASDFSVATDSCCDFSILY